MNEPKYVDATYITASGTTFDFKAEWPHQNSVTLRWAPAENEDDDEPTVLEFVYFGSYKNRLVYHEIEIEEKIVELS